MGGVERNQVVWFPRLSGPLPLPSPQPKTLICFPSQETIARLTCHDRRTVVRIIGDLVALGFIEKTKKGRGLQYRPVSPVHMSLSGCEIGDPTRDVGTHQTVSSFPTEVKENLKRKSPGLTFSPFAPDHLPTTDSIEHDEGHHRYPQQWMTRAHKMERRLPSKVQAEIRRKLEMDPNERLSGPSVPVVCRIRRKDAIRGNRP